MQKQNEVDQIRSRYDRRKNLQESKYSLLNPAVYMGVQERQRALIRVIRDMSLRVFEAKVLEVGCGSGANLNELLRLGFNPKNLVGNELLEERASAAREALSSKIEIIEGDACELEFEEESFDIVYQSTVFTSILDREFQQKLANKMWKLTKSGGGILWYDFIYDNPKNPDVKGVSVQRIKELFPDSRNMKFWKVTLAPPISRGVTKIHPGLYNIFNLLPCLRTHVLGWIEKN